MNIENGSIINQYKIISPIGKGGMSEVYLAEDAKLDRKVGLKQFRNCNLCEAIRSVNNICKY